MESTSTNADLQSTKIVAYALMGGLAIFVLIVSYLNQSGNGIGSGALIDPTIDLALVGGVGLMCLLSSRFVSNQLLQNASREDKQDLSKAAGIYRSAKIVRLALLEGAGLMGAVFALITGNNLLLLIALFMLAMMWLVKPSEQEFAEWRG